MQRRVIFLQARAPAKPPPGQACNGCGACCAAFRVSFYWGAGDDAPGGAVPAEATEPVNPFLRCMRGTHSSTPRCDMLVGDVPGARCAIYERRPSPCREFVPYQDDGQPDPRCTEARRRHALPPLAPRG